MLLTIWCPHTFGHVVHIKIPSSMIKKIKQAYLRTTLYINLFRRWEIKPHFEQGHLKPTDSSHLEKYSQEPHNI